jgi:hypothetical protein
MKIKELIELLEKQNPDDIVVLSKDEEGNGFTKAFELSEAIYHDGEIYLRELTEDLSNAGYNEEDLYDGDDGESCVVIWP